MQNIEENDETLVLLTLTGNTRAYEQLVKKYQKAVLASAVSVTGNVYMAEDAAQDTFVVAWIKLNTLKTPEKYGVWVCKIAKNCARKTVMRYKSHLSFDELENLNITDGEAGNPAIVFINDEGNRELQLTVSKLSKKVREVIELHYFKGLSVSEIANKLGVSTSTVKWQLHDGRKRLRKELCAMNEEWNDTLIKRVMKKVEELKEWYCKNNKSGFEKVYKDTLAEIEELPECYDKFHALADVLMLGWWWIPGEKNAELLKRIKEYAMLGKNDEVMASIIECDLENLYGNIIINYILNELIPSLSKEDFPITLSTALLNLTYEYNEREEYEKSKEIYEQILNTAPKNHIIYAFALAQSKTLPLICDRFRDKSDKNYSVVGCGCEIRLSGSSMVRHGHRWSLSGSFWSYDRNADLLFESASLCDMLFFDLSMKVGDITFSSDKNTTIEYASDNETVKTPAGVFTDCCLWVTCYGEDTHKVYYKRGVGIVKYEKICLENVEIRVLKSYNVADSKDFFPCSDGNKWEYTTLCDSEYMLHGSTIEVVYADKEKAMLSQVITVEHIKYNENSWLDMIRQIRSEYFDGKEVCDVSYPMKRAAELAVTPIQKLHTRVACSVAQRIMDTHGNSSSEEKTTGHWNFFNRRIIKFNEEKISMSDWSFQWSFELKCFENSPACFPLLYNDIYGILQSNTGCIWSDEWAHKDKITVQSIQWGSVPIKSEIVSEKDVTVTTNAGTFNKCIKLTLNTIGIENTTGLEYIGGKKTYYFADGIGIVKTESVYNGVPCVYELTSFSGTGDGYMPSGDGFERRYDAIGLTDGYIANTTYSYIEHDSRIVIFEDRCGIRKPVEDITRYDSIKSERDADKLWNEGKHTQAVQRANINTLNQLMHMLRRPYKYVYDAAGAVEWNRYVLRLIGALSKSGKTLSAWYGMCMEVNFKLGCALMGNGQYEEGYESIETAIELADKYKKISAGDLLEISDMDSYKGIKYVHEMNLLELPDGTRELLYEPYFFNGNTSLIYYGMTAVSGWEWFNGVRDEPRYKKLVEKAKEYYD